MNKIYIKNPVINRNRINYSYKVEGEWSAAFKTEEPFYIEYNIDVSSVPASIAIVPLMCNILPIAWVYDAHVYLEECDKSFYDSIEDIRQGYQGMFPMMDFKAEITAEKVIKNDVHNNGSAAAFFSGGADAFNTLVMHADEKPTLLTVWGADVKFNDIEGWNNVLTHLRDTAQQFGVDYVTIKSCLRRCFNEAVLCSHVMAAKDSWWHGFQHGIGIIGHAAPVSYVLKKETIYFASSFTAADKGKVTCASDPTIDNMLRFGDTHIVHDGYEFARQMKIHNITSYAKKHNKKIALRVCWKSTGGSNCCKCEKCWRTMLGIYAEHFNPRDFGFSYTDEAFKKTARRMRYSDDPMLSELRYGPIQDAMRSNWNVDEIDKNLVWFYKRKREKLGKHPIITFTRKATGKFSRKLKRILRR